jgi:hypothetical protein
MTLKQFFQENNVTAYEVVSDNLIMNVVVDQTTYGLDVDTSNIIGGTPLIKFEDFTINGDFLTVNGITININEVNMLGSDIPIVE